MTRKITILIACLVANILVYAQGSSVCFSETRSVNTMSVGLLPNSMTAGDFNNDGYQDIAVGNINSGFVSVLLGTNSGVFTHGIDILPAVISGVSMSWNTRIIKSGDFNNDGNIDLVLFNQQGINLVIMFGTGTGSFNFHQLISTV